jgi:WD40 repeat protein
MIGVAKVLFAPDGRTFATVGRTDDGDERGSPRNRTMLWQTATGKHLRTLKEPTGTCLAFSPDRKHLAAASNDGTAITFREVRTGKEVATWKAPRYIDRAGHLLFSPDGKMLALYYWYASRTVHSEVKWWNVKTRKELARLAGDGKVAFGPLAFSPDSATLAIRDSEGVVRLVEAATGKERGRLEAGKQGLGGLLFSPNGKTLATWQLPAGPRPGDEDRTVKLWDMASRKARSVPTGHDGGVLTVAFSPDGKVLATGGADGKVRLWEPANGKERRCLVFTTAPRSRVRHLVFSPDGKTLVATGQETGGGPGRTTYLTKFWDTASGKERAALQGAHTVTFAPDGRKVVVVSGSQRLRGGPAKPDEVRLWDVGRLFELKGKE